MPKWISDTRPFGQVPYPNSVKEAGNYLEMPTSLTKLERIVGECRSKKVMPND